MSHQIQKTFARVLLLTVGLLAYTVQGQVEPKRIIPFQNVGYHDTLLVYADEVSEIIPLSYWNVAFELRHKFSGEMDMNGGISYHGYRVHSNLRERHIYWGIPFAVLPDPRLNYGLMYTLPFKKWEGQATAFKQVYSKILPPNSVYHYREEYLMNNYPVKSMNTWSIRLGAAGEAMYMEYDSFMIHGISIGIAKKKFVGYQDIQARYPYLRTEYRMASYFVDVIIPYANRPVSSPWGGNDADLRPGFEIGLNASEISGGYVPYNRKSKLKGMSQFDLTTSVGLAPFAYDDNPTISFNLRLAIAFHSTYRQPMLDPIAEDAQQILSKYWVE